ncbi:TlpA family protein disulfide reductase [Gordonia neofelifaecis]|uniref:Alkyl hydroperoxide reductase/ Thiol specific antioxidant/ Mal allergen n=1 Tax=Gordonia neofelifaecis NRRL B-59395 TaxID=644548 RepID=F1YJZ6_9ACTN|nr:TlpA disulfide reductase family protein [Gordonia neofelifaecis]EGD55078.1 alkyl hydroperoxide reductase/ Thiol specific antioxidant/ Mal allergen [Gordonia neofelifaecis NRRL B-59395]
MKILKEPAARATLAFVIVAAALIVALWPRSGPGDTSSGSGSPAASSTQGITDQQVSDDELSKARAAAALAPCPDGPGPAVPDAVLAGVTVPCMATGAPVDLGVTTAGKPLVINMWAVWCLPCRRELPIFDDFSKRAGDSLNVLAVHAREGGDKPYFVLKFLEEVGVHLPVVTDPDGAVAKAIGAPRVFPSTVMIRADGTVAKVLPQVFESEAELAEAVRENLGVDVGAAQ